MRQWEHGMIIKQADATMERTVDYYRAHYDDNPIMMGYAIDGIIDCRLGRSREVSETLGHLSRYFRLPYLLTTESPANERLPFLSGMGGFHQFVANGMAGLITDQPGGLASHWACLPDGIDWIRLHGVHHAGKRHGVELKRDASGKPVVEVSPEGYSSQ